MAEPGPVRQRALHLEYRFDRLLPDKLAQAYQVLVPDKRWPIPAKRREAAPESAEMNDEQSSRDLRSCLL